MLTTNTTMNFYNRTSPKQPVPAYRENTRLRDKSKYIVSPALEKAVNVAILLGQPLLLTGEPGTGKTELAHHLADFFDPDGRSDNLYIFNTKTTSSARDLFYRYDSLKHFQYAQNNDTIPSTEEVEKRFITYQAVGKAIKANRRCIVLIDEVDKAPRDLPNDILDVLENLSFEVPEIGKVGDQCIRTTPENRPIVILTSNSEKNLPDAFLRRCVFHHIPFPDDAMLLRIVKSKVSSLSEGDLDIAIAHFNDIRSKCERKKPATAELLQWVSVLEKLDESGRLKVAKIKDVDKLTEEEKNGVERDVWVTGEKQRGY